MEKKFVVQEGEKFSTFKISHDKYSVDKYTDRDGNILHFEFGHINKLVTRDGEVHHFKSSGSCFSLMKFYHIKTPDFIIVCKIDPNNKIKFNDEKKKLYLHGNMYIGEKYDFEISNGKVTRVYKGNTCYDLVNNYSTDLEKFFYLEKNGKRLVSMKEGADIITLVENDEEKIFKRDYGCVLKHVYHNKEDKLYFKDNELKMITINSGNHLIDNGYSSSLKKHYKYDKENKKVIVNDKKLGNDKMIITNIKNSSKFDLNEDRFTSLLNNESYTWLGNKRYISVDNKVKRIETYSDDLLIHIEFLN